MNGWIAMFVCLSVLGGGEVMRAQQKPERLTNPVQLELTAEVATTTDEGYPSAVRVTLKNIGSVPADLPPLHGDCHPEGGIAVIMYWTPPGERDGFGPGGGCGAAGSIFAERIDKDWVRLRQGEFLTATLPMERTYPHESGTVHYRVIFSPPDVSNEDLRRLSAAGYEIPTEHLQTHEETFETY